MIAPQDTEPVSRVWAEQLDARQIIPELYDELLNRAITHRTEFLKRGENPPALTVELLIAMFDKYRSEKRAEYSKRFPTQGRWEQSEALILGTEKRTLPDGTDAPLMFEHLITEAAYRFNREFESFDELREFVAEEKRLRPERKQQFWIDANLPGEISFPRREAVFTNA